MNNMPMRPLSPAEQQRLMSQMYNLLGKQVKSYHKHRHMGDNTSVPVELARELMESMEYTIEQAGGFAMAGDAQTALELGQKILESKVEKATAMLDLVAATAPVWQTECRWEALSCLRRYLAGYDHCHLAHREPDELFYPVLVSVPETIKGIDVCQFYLNVLWTENQIMAGFNDAVLERLWNRMPADTLNQFEQVLIGGIGKIILHGSCDDLVFEESERQRLLALLSNQNRDQLHTAAENGAMDLCLKMDLADSNAAAFIRTAVQQLLPRIDAAVRHNDLSAVFL